MPDDWQKPFIDWRGPLEANAVWVALDLINVALERVLDRRPGAPGGLIICGATGSGKDYVVDRAFKARHLPMLILDTSSEAALVKFAWRHRQARAVVVSDNRKLLTQELILDRLKHLMDPGHVHYETAEVIANMKRPTTAERAWLYLGATDPAEQAKIKAMKLRDPDIPECDFDTEFCLIWTSNNNYTDPKAIPPALRPHWAALLSRGINPRYIPDEPGDLFVYALHLILERSMLRGRHLKLEDSNAVLRAYIEKRGYLTDVSPRCVRRLADLRAELRSSDRLPYWDRQVQSMCATKIVNPELAKLEVPVFQIPPK